MARPASTDVLVQTHAIQPVVDPKHVEFKEDVVDENVVYQEPTDPREIRAVNFYNIGGAPITTVSRVCTKCTRLYV